MVVAHMNSEQLWLSAEDSYYLSTKLHKINQVEKNVNKRWEEFQRHSHPGAIGSCWLPARDEVSISFEGGYW